MQFKYLMSLWGRNQQAPMEEHFKLAKELGLDGVHTRPHFAPPEEIRELCEKYDLIYIPLFGANTIEEFEQMIEFAVPHNPPIVCCHPGRDFMDFEEGCKFFERALEIEKQVGFPVAHETHKIRLLFTPFHTAKYLQAFPDLKLNADFSNWIAVCPTLIDDMQHWVDEAIERSIFIHSRVGHPEVMQVNDPRAPENEHLLSTFEGWWERILEKNKNNGRETFYICQEWATDWFHLLPYTQRPISNTDDIIRWQNARFKDKWKKFE